MRSPFASTKPSRNRAAIASRYYFQTLRPALATAAHALGTALKREKPNPGARPHSAELPIKGNPLSRRTPAAPGVQAARDRQGALDVADLAGAEPLELTFPLMAVT